MDNLVTFYLEDANLVIIDLALNIFRFRQMYRSSEFSFDTAIMLNPEWVDKLRRELSSLRKERPDAWIGINMEFIHSCQDSGAFTCFTRDIQGTSKIFFYNILPDSVLLDRLNSDLQLSGTVPEFDRENGILHLAKPEGVDGKSLTKQCEKAVLARLKDSVKGLISPQDPPDLLASSSVYVDHYVDAKRLFMQPDELYLIVYYMSSYLSKIDQDYHGLVASSKNGAVLAALLGKMTGKQVIYCVNVGPQYALPADAAEQIQPGKRYVYVCDFICLGTEVKLLHALMSNRRAALVNGIGIANYIPLHNPELNEKHSPLAFMNCLVDLISSGISYNVYLKKDKNGPQILESKPQASETKPQASKAKPYLLGKEV